MIKIVFVGDEPSKTNANPGIAFVGAKSFKNLVKWIKLINPDYYICLNSNNDVSIRSIIELNSHGFKVVALGNKAFDRLISFIPLKDLFALPHPSGLNRKLNDKAYLEQCLNDIKRGIRE